MEEVVMFLQSREIACCLQEAFEHSRSQGDCWSPASLLNIGLSKGYSHSNLKRSDPPRWVFMDGSPLRYPGEAAVPDGFSVFMDWLFVVEPSYSDRRGWKYHLDYQNGVLLPTRGSAGLSAERKFRLRRWQRVLVESSTMKQAQQLVESELHAANNSIRTLSPQMIGAALGKADYQIQFILESQRRSETGTPFRSSELTALDPATWTSGTLENLTEDPTTVPTENLQEVFTSELNHTNGWTALHEFLFTVHPDKDEEGWEYNKSFSEQFSGEWHTHPSNVDLVRRRLWIRPCVRDEQLNMCRDRLQRYIAAHPRGIIKEGRIQRQSHFRKRWCDGTAVLTDTKLEITLENNYQGVVIYDLVGCEVVSEFDTDDSTGHSFRFGLRMINQVQEETQEMRCILNARSKEEQLEWVTVLSRQVSQVNLFFWNLTFGPPIHNEILIQGNMWKQGSLRWQFRRFELHGDGVLSYWKDNILKGKIKLSNCTVEQTETGYPFSFMVKKKNGYCLVLRTSDEKTKIKWIEAIQDHISSSFSPEKSALPVPGVETRQRSLTDVPKLSLSSDSTTEKIPEKLLGDSEPESNIANEEDIQECNESKTESDSFARKDKRDSPPPNLEAEHETVEVLNAHEGAGSKMKSIAPSHPIVASRRATVGPGVSTATATHTVDINRKTGRRMSILTEAFKAEVAHQSSGIWEASDDSDESECSERSMSSSFIDVRASRNKSAVAALFNAANVRFDEIDKEIELEGSQSEWNGAPWEVRDVSVDDGPTHQVLKDNKGRRISVLNDTVLDSAAQNDGQWGGFDSDESDGESSRPSSMSSRTESAHYTRRSKKFSESSGGKIDTIPEDIHEPEHTINDEKKSTGNSVATIVSNFIAKRRHSVL